MIFFLSIFDHANSWRILSSDHDPDTVLNAADVLTHLILMAQSSRYLYYSHFTEKVTGARDTGTLVK